MSWHITLNYRHSATRCFKCIYIWSAAAAAALAWIFHFASEQHSDGIFHISMQSSRLRAKRICLSQTLCPFHIDETVNNLRCQRCNEHTDKWMCTHHPLVCSVCARGHRRTSPQPCQSPSPLSGQFLGWSVPPEWQVHLETAWWSH